MTDRIASLDLTPPAQAAGAAEAKSIDLYQSQATIHTRRIRGYFQRLRRLINWPLMAGFFLLPWFSINGQPALLFDLAERRFHVFGLTFWPQDGILLAWILILAAFALFTATVWAGRVWCGFTCPQTVWTLIFIWIEDKCEGDRHRRIKLDSAPWSLEKGLRKSAKHGLWLSFSLLSGLTFISYFYGIQPLLMDLAQLQASLEAWFWISLFTGFTYLNAGWLREQVCQYMCPYSRIQSVMYDRDSLLVTYDEARGQHREASGDCVNCDWCVQVCPAGIDIREGLQAECINCGLCIDACDKVMDKLDKARGLIRFSSQTAMESAQAGTTGAKLTLWRPRLVGYSLALFLMGGYLVYDAASRVPLSLDVIRDRGTHMFRLRGDSIENIYTVKLNNMSREPQRYRISVEGDLDYQLKLRQPIVLEEGETFTLPLRVRVNKQSLLQSHNQIVLIAQAIDNPKLRARQTASFIGPGSG